MSTRSWAVIGAALSLLTACASSAERAGPAPTDVGPIDVAPSDTRPEINPGVCIGPTPPATAWGAKPGPVVVLPDAGGDATLDTSVVDASGDVASDTGDGATPAAPTAIGAPMPVYALNDFQPQSCGFKATYGLEPFKGKVTVVALLASW